MAAEIETQIYRIAQEALNNAGKHARATNVRVIVSRDQDSITCTIRDDGVGFDPEAARVGQQGLGLLGIEERVAACGGSLQIHSAPGCGTELVAEIPLRT